MDPEITPEQKQQLESWALQRDNILGDLAVKQSENDRLDIANRTLSDSNTEIQNKINQLEGRLVEMSIKEAEFNDLMRIDNAELNRQKTELETILGSLKNEIEMLKTEKISLEGIIQNYTDVYRDVYHRSDNLDQEIAETKKINSENIKEIGFLLESFKKSLEEVWAINEENVKKGNYILQELPRMFFDLQRQSLIRPKI